MNRGRKLRKILLHDFWPLLGWLYKSFGNLSGHSNTTFFRRHQVPPYLWLMQTFLKCCKVSKYYVQDCGTESYSEPFQTSKMELFTKIVNEVKLLTNFAKIIILDLCQGSEYTYAGRVWRHTMCFHEMCLQTLYFRNFALCHLCEHAKIYSLNTNIIISDAS